MTKNHKTIGSILFWLLWPGLFFYLKGSSRARVIIVRNKQILLVRNWLGPGQYSLPGGGLQPNEKPIDGAAREIKEETGISINPKSLTQVIPSFITSDKGHSYKCYSYSVEVDKTTKISRQKFEIAEVRWVKFEDVLSKYCLSYTAKSLITTWLDHNHLLD